METTTTTKTPYEFAKQLGLQIGDAQASPFYEMVRGYNDLRNDLKKTYQSVIRQAERAIATIDQGFTSLSHDELGSNKEDLVRIHAQLSIRREQLQVMAYQFREQGIEINPFDFVI